MFFLTKFLKFYPQNKNRSFFLTTYLWIYNDHQSTNDFLNSLASNSFIPYILHPNRITSHSKTLIVNIFSNYISNEIISGNINAAISDHLPQSLFVPNNLLNPSAQISNFYGRHWSKLKQESFILDYFDKDWADLLQVDIFSMDIFLNKMDSILDTHAPLKKVNKYKLKFKTNCWITPALQLSILLKQLTKKVHNCKKSSNKRNIS